MQEFSELKTLQESPNKYPTRNEMIKELLKDHEAVIVKLREDIDSSNTQDVNLTKF